MPSDRPFVGRRPFLVVRARIDEPVQPEFRRWFRTVQVPHMLTIPGVTGAHAIRGGGRAAWLILLEFAPDTDIEGALRSPQAQRAREDWDKWQDYVRDLAMEVYAPLSAIPALQHWN